ncbi:MAG: hypothetical protein IPK93_02715 [Solirubrobacterales bacterium]|nr:hypothetical protein [Solirubrobacterales bacterium]
MSVEPTPIDADLTAYIKAHASGRDEALKKVEEQTAAMGSIVMMQTAPEQAAFLEMLVGMAGARLALEVGTFTGYGAIRIARGLAPGGRLICFELEQERADIARTNLDQAGVGEQVEIVVGPAIEGIRTPAERAGNRLRLPRRRQNRLPGLLRGTGAPPEPGGPTRDRQRLDGRANPRHRPRRRNGCGPGPEQPNHE